MGKSGLIHAARLAALTIIYVASGKFGLWLAATGGGYAAPVWPPTGVALAAIMAWGFGMAPGVWVGAFIVNFLVRGGATPANILTAATIATGNMLEALAIGYLLKKMVRFSIAFEKLADFTGFLLVSVVCPVVSATMGVGAIRVLRGLEVSGNPLQAWLTWWVGDALGALVVGPFLLMLLTGRKQLKTPGPRRLGISHSFAYGVFATLLGLCYFVPVVQRELFLSFIVYSALIWFTLVGSTRVMFVATAAVSALMVAAVLTGHGPFSLQDNMVQRLFLLQFCLGCISSTMMLLRGVLAEQQAAAALAHSRELALIASEKMSLLGLVTSGIAHEINNPLSVIYGKAALARTMIETGKFEPSAIATSLEKIEGMANRIEKIIDSVRFISRTQESDPFERAPMRSIIEDTLELCRDHFRKSRVELIVDLPPQHLDIECRPVQIAQVLLNLLTNAVAAAEQSPGRWVRLSARCTGENAEQVEVSIVDSGSGVPPDSREDIFRPFFTTKKPGEGTGLGLSLSRSIVSQHGGSIVLDDKNPHTRFVVTLPLAKLESSVRQ